MSSPGPVRRGPLAWMAVNSVAANLLMMVVMIGGLLIALSLKQEVFPEFEMDVIRVTVPYPGASPEEGEQGIVLAHFGRALPRALTLTVELEETAGYRSPRSRCVLEIHEGPA